MKGIGARGIQRTASDGLREGFRDEAGLGQHLETQGVRSRRTSGADSEERVSTAKPQAFVGHCGRGGWRHRQGQIPTGFVFSGRILRTPDIT